MVSAETLSSNAVPCRVHEYIDRVAYKYPDNIALVFGEQTLTYERLRDSSDRLAINLVRRGVKQNQLVGLYVERSFEMVIAALAILKANAAYVPLDRHYPQVRLEQMIRDSGTSLIVTTDAEKKGIEFSGSQIHLIHEDEQANHPLIQPLPQSKQSVDESFAYVIYTSGTTGIPKGIVVTHANLTHFLNGMLKVFTPDQSARYLFRTSISFDPHILELFLPLMVGGTVVILPESETYSPSLLGQVINKSGITLVQATPSIWRSMIQVGWKPVSSLVALCGGELLSEQLKNILLEFQQLELWNVYGPTETTVWCAALQMQRHEPVRMGGVIDGANFLVLDEKLAPVQDGELFIDSPGLAYGYLHQKELTERAFIPHPFSDHPTARLYRTGDLVRQFPDGRLECLGRKDHQVKIRGYRIELREVELAIEQDGDVSGVVVLAKDSQYLISYVVPRYSPCNITELALKIKETVRNRLPPYMIPARVVVLKCFPLTPNGKVDRTALLVLAPVEESDPEEPASNIMMSKIKSIWEDILDLKGIAYDSHFLDIGGHSLNVVVLQVRILEEFKTDLDISSIYTHDTIEGLCRLIEAKMAKHQIKRSPEDTPRSSQVLRLSPSQELLFNETSLYSIHHNNLEFLVTTHEFKTTVLHAIQHLLVRHDVFTVERIFEQDGNWAQQFGLVPVRLPKDLGSCSNLSMLMNEIDQCRRTMSLVEGILYNWVVSEVEKVTYIYFIGNHLLFDGISIDILQNELDMILHEPNDARLPQTEAFAEWLNHASTTSAITEYIDQIPVWMNQIQRSSTEQKVREKGASFHKLELIQRRFQKLPALSLVTRKTWYLAASVSSFSQTFDLKSVPCRIVHSGRNLRSGFSDGMTVGWLSHHFPLWIDVGTDLCSTFDHVIGSLDNIPRSGCAYGWLRYRLEHLQIVQGLQLSQCLLYFNFLPSSQYRMRYLNPANSLIPPFKEARSEMIGIGIVIVESRSEITVTTFFDEENLSRTSVDNFISAYANNLEQIRALIDQ